MLSVLLWAEIAAVELPSRIYTDSVGGSTLGLAQFALSSALLILLVVTPPAFTPATHPTLTSSPISLHLFAYLEAPLLAYYRSPTLTNFQRLVPLLPSSLRTNTVRKAVRKGDAENAGLKEFVRKEKREIGVIVVYCTVWIVGVFASPLALNLLLTHLQTPSSPTLPSSSLSPTFLILLIFLSPIVTSVAFQSATYRTTCLGLKLRSLLGSRVFERVLRNREGEGRGRVNNLVGTDIDVLTSSLGSFIQLLGVPPKLVVSLLGLYLLLGWSSFVALGVVLATDARITLVSELVSSIRTIKIFGWEGVSKKRIEETREVELERIMSRGRVFGGMMLLSTGVPTVVTLATFASYVFAQGETLTASTAFTSMALFGLLREAVISTTYLSSAFMRARVSLNRITDFLQNSTLVSSYVSTSSSTSDAPGVILHPGSYAFSSDPSSFKLEVKEKVVFPKGKTTIVCGDVGCGKSGLLMTLLGEMSVVDGQGKVEMVDGGVSYAGQEAWLRDDTIKNNIIFSEEYDEERYQAVLQQCALENDLEQMKDGDQTMVGEKGVAVSGGQKQRIALARAVYAKTEVVLLDDVLSAVDSHTVSHLITHCLNGSLLYNRTVILVTHYVKLTSHKLSSCSLIVTLSSGQILSLHDPSEDREAGGSGGLTPLMDKGRSGSKPKVVPKRKDDSDEQIEVAWGVYKEYFGAMGGKWFWSVYAVVNVVAHVLMLAQGWWVSKWVNADGERTTYYFTIYGIIQLVASVSLTAMYLTLIWGAIRASRILHTRLLNSIFGTFVRFFDATPQGNIVNRFSKDTETVDTEIVESTQPVLDYAVQVAFVAIMISFILPIFLLPALIIGGLFVIVGRLYIRSALASRKQVASARSPLFSTLGDALTGAATIRAFGRQNVFLSTYVRQTDNYNRMQLYESSLERWLQERSDFVAATVAGVIAYLALRGGLSSGTIGFLVSSGNEFTSRILYVVRALNQQQLAINSAHRVIQYSELEQEPRQEGKAEPPASWPHDGAIEFDNYSAGYVPGAPDVLQNLSFSIKAGEKVGIVGATGSGKSSIALALLRVLHHTDGQILLDGRALSETSLEAIRTRITMIPQESTLFSGSLRTNLDPTGTAEDADLWAAIKRSRFSGEEEEDEGRKGGKVSLDTEVQSGGSNFSQGQRQLLSLARALVRDSNVIILDEATASLDNKTDELVQKVIREEFSRATTLTIAHRLESIMDFDRVAVVSEGTIAEFDTPKALLDRKDSRFHEMVEATGDFDELYKMVKGT
ncbi:ABC transporter [Pseudohyphozyma bogoriensis]|nr:ABC transporter [Pseudohyphozyma bogoriensis]